MALLTVVICCYAIIIVVIDGQRTQRQLAAHKQQQQQKPICPRVLWLHDCCLTTWQMNCVSAECYNYATFFCADKRLSFAGNGNPLIPVVNHAAGPVAIINNAIDPRLASTSSAERRRAQQTSTNGTNKRTKQHGDTTYPRDCGTPSSDYAACVPKKVADRIFLSCCQQYVSFECQHLCQYETDANRARKMLTDTLRTGHCSMQYMSSILHCAAQNNDNRDCCAMLHMSEQRMDAPKAEHCLRFCDPAGAEPIKRLQLEDISCLYNWNVIMYCHQSGLRG